MGTFDERVAHLSREVGVGHIVARCEVNQPYAQNQHENMSFRHTNGRDHYLGGPLLENALRLVSDVSRRVITPTGSDVEDAMIEVAEWMAQTVMVHAPKETGRLSESGHPSVTSNGIPTYDRPPLAPREAD